MNWVVWCAGCVGGDGRAGMVWEGLEWNSLEGDGKGEGKWAA